jgi:chromosomal replication initiation ATPase DnaA
MNWNTLSWADRREVLSWACRAAGTTINEVRSRDRTAAASARRMMVCALLRTQGASYPQIGALVERDHVTVMHAQRIVDSRPELRARVDELAGTVPL